ncbi:hypothetical protein VNO77_34351 [Canavalia gladiata]|uniref:Uncharacterized protein n=1 Tax=Canavalia gladiata TaxID=3824 RepID=A0AAN9KE58_CANGL
MWRNPEEKKKDSFLARILRDNATIVNQKLISLEDLRIRCNHMILELGIISLNEVLDGNGVDWSIFNKVVLIDPKMNDGDDFSRARLSDFSRARFWILLKQPPGHFIHSVDIWCKVISASCFGLLNSPSSIRGVSLLVPVVIAKRNRICDLGNRGYVYALVIAYSGKYVGSIPQDDLTIYLIALRDMLAPNRERIGIIGNIRGIMGARRIASQSLNHLSHPILVVHTSFGKYMYISGGVFSFLQISFIGGARIRFSSAPFECTRARICVNHAWLSKHLCGVRTISNKRPVPVSRLFVRLVAVWIVPQKA